MDFAEVWWEFFDRIPIFADTYSKWIKRLQLIKSVGIVLSCSEPSCVSRRRPSVSQVLRQIFRSLRQMEDLGRLGCDHVYQPNQAIWKYYAVVSRHFKANDAPGSPTVEERRSRSIKTRILGSGKRERFISQSCIGISCHSLSMSTVCKLSVSTVCKLSSHSYAPCNSISHMDLSRTR